MQWTPGDRSNVEDNRGRFSTSMGRGIPIGIGGFVVLLFLSWVTGTNYLALLSSPDSSSSTGATGTSGHIESTKAEERDVDFVDAVMKDVQQTWTNLLPGQYQPTRAVLFRNAIDSACGFAQSATGPFYCPQDGRVYLDLGFFGELKERFGAPGDFARAYVLAHEVGHHIQRLTGTERRVQQAVRDNPAAANALSVRVELQADCFAGVWGHFAAEPGRAAHGQVELEPRDEKEGLNAASAIGDDRLQRMTTGHIAPDRFTHGTSAQRVEWFRKGLTAGTPQSCDTFTQDPR